MYDRSKLIGRIVEMYGTRSAFGEKIGWKIAQVSLVLRGKRSLREDEIALWADALGILIEEIGTYFFTKRVCECEQ